MISAEQKNLNEASDMAASGVSWGSIFAGAAAAAALSLILLILGVGLGFSVISPWSDRGASAAAIGISSILWLAFTQIAASGIGGYLAGRLRIKWATVHTDEVYFRDTAHGFLAWAIASLAAAALFGSVAANVVSRGVSAGATAASAAVGAAGAVAATVNSAAPMGSRSVNDITLGYMVDSLFRAEKPPTDSNATTDNAAWLEAVRIFSHDLHLNNFPAEDRQYLAQVVAKRTGLSSSDADRRVSDIFNKAHAAITDAEQNAKQAADKARKAAAYSALWMFVALLSGAFVASLSATFGGRRRDCVTHIHRDAI